MADIWLEGYERMPLGDDVAGEWYAEDDNPKLLWHRTEGGSVEGAVNAYRPYPPHLIVDPATGRRVQHIPLNFAAYSLLGGANDLSRVVQVEVVGFSSDSPRMPAHQRQWLANNVVRPVREAFGVSDDHLRFYSPEEANFVLASPSSPIRLSVGSLRGFSGHLGHQHAPAPDEHWDPGGLPIADIIARSHTEEDDMFTDDDRKTQAAINWRLHALTSGYGTVQGGPDLGEAVHTADKLYETLHDIRRLLALAVAGEPLPADDPGPVTPGGDDFPLVKLLRDVDAKLDLLLDQRSA